MSDECRCVDCGTVFGGAERGDVCPACGSARWVPNERCDDPGDPDGESGSKWVTSYEYRTRERAGPQEDITELVVETADGWTYVFRELLAGEGHELFEKYRPDGTESDDDVVPRFVAEYIDSELAGASVNYAKLVVHPSDEVYAAPDREGKGEE